MMENWTQLVIGIIMIISPWILGFSDITLAKWCNVLVGVILVLINGWKLFGESPAAAMIVAEEKELKKTKSNKSNVEQK